MATKVLNSLKGRVIRLTRLDACGVPVIGACSTIVTDGFISVDFSPEEESGEEFTQKNAWGDLCISEKDADLVKWVNVTIKMCEVHPDVLDLVAGGTSLTSGVDTVGTSFGQSYSATAFALEVWTKQAGSACEGGSPEWGYFLFPFCKNGKVAGVGPIENGTMDIDVSGEAQPAPADWGINPYEDNPLLHTGGMPTGDIWAVARTTVQPPAVTDGCVALAAPV